MLLELMSNADHAALSHAIQQLPVRKLSTAMDDSNEGESAEIECAICLCTCKSGDMLRTLPCGHEFHPPCVDRWLLGFDVHGGHTRRDADGSPGQLPSCPLCKMPPFASPCLRADLGRAASASQTTAAAPSFRPARLNGSGSTVRGGRREERSTYGADVQLLQINREHVEIISPADYPPLDVRDDIDIATA